jgi:hypothetical protein
MNVGATHEMENYMCVCRYLLNIIFRFHLTSKGRRKSEVRKSVCMCESGEKLPRNIFIAGRGMRRPGEDLLKQIYYVRHHASFILMLLLFAWYVF